MNKILSIITLTAIVAVGASAEILIKKEVQVYNVPLKAITNNTITNPNLSEYGVLVKKEEQINNNAKNIEYSNKATVIFNKNYTKEQKIKILLKLLQKNVKNSDLITKKSILQLIDLIKQSLPSQK